MPLRHSTSSRKRAPAAPLPPRLRVLEQLQLSVAVSRPSKRDVRYELRAAHAPSGVAWRQRRSFEEYHAFQQRLLQAMRHGHFCEAECPFLYTFVKSYFPRPALFGATSACAVDKRREALARCLDTLQKFVVDRANLSCAVVSTAVADAVFEFVVGDVANPAHPLHAVVQQQLQQQLAEDANCSSSRSSCLSFTSSTSDESEEPELDAGCGLCALCNSSLDGEAFADVKTPPMLGSRSSSASSCVSSRCSSLSYTTTLACGHIFHDECIVAELNARMACPTCGLDLAAAP